MSGLSELCAWSRGVWRARGSRTTVLALSVLVVLMIYLGRDRGPTVDRSLVWIDSVRTAPFRRDIFAAGTLQPEAMALVSAVTSGRVAQLTETVGSPVTPATVILELENPDVLLQSMTADQQLASAVTAQLTTNAQLDGQIAARQASLTSAIVAEGSAARAARVADTLYSKELISREEQEERQARLLEATGAHLAEEQQLHFLRRLRREQEEAANAQTATLRQMRAAARDRISSLKVRSAARGTLQEVTVELGQWVTPGTVLARVAGSGRLQAILRVPEGEAREVAVGQEAEVDLHPGKVIGHVTRVDPAISDRFVSVHVSLPDGLPPGTRIGSNVEGVIYLETPSEALVVGRPALNFAENDIQLFRLRPAGDRADLVPVRFGRVGNSVVEVLDGLSAGDRVIISDMSAWSGERVIRIR